MWGAQSLTCSSTQSCDHHPHAPRTFPVCETTVDLLWNVLFSSTFRFLSSSSEIKVWADQTPLSVPRASAIVLKVYSFDKLEPAFKVWLRFTQELNNAMWCIHEYGHMQWDGGEEKSVSQRHIQCRTVHSVNLGCPVSFTHVNDILTPFYKTINQTITAFGRVC